MKVNKTALNEYREFLLQVGLSDEEATLVIRSKQFSGNRQQSGMIRLEKSDDNSAEMYIYDYIGFDPFTGGVGAKDVARQLADMGAVDQIRVKINSPGGNVFDAMTIMNLLDQNPARVMVEIDGLAASAASIVAMAGDEIKIAESGMMMIHRASLLAYGNAQDMLEVANLLEKVDGQIANVYARRSGRKPETFRKMMDAETWMTGQEAVDERLATAVMPSKKAAAMAFDLSGFRNAPAMPEPEDHRPPQEAIAARLKLLEAQDA